MNWLIDSRILKFSGRTSVFCKAYILDIFTGTPLLNGRRWQKETSHHFSWYGYCIFSLPLEARLFILSHSLIIHLIWLYLYYLKHKSECFIVFFALYTLVENQLIKIYQSFNNWLVGKYTSGICLLNMKRAWNYSPL